MPNQNIHQIVELIRLAFETRDFKPMVDSFADDGVYETPQALDAAHSKNSGITAIRERFSRVSESPWNKAVQIDKVTVQATPMADAQTVLAEFFISGVRKSDGVAFDFPSSIAIIRVENGQIKHYRDYPNILGLSKAAGVLTQFAATLKG